MDWNSPRLADAVLDFSPKLGSHDDSPQINFLNLIEAKGSKFNDAPVEEQLKQFGDKHRLKLVAIGNSLNYLIQFEGKEQLLFSTDNSARGLKRAESKLDSLVKEKKEELTNKYNVSFSSAGEDIEGVRATGDSKERGAIVKSREPELYELLGIEAALGRTEETLEAGKGSSVKFYFPEFKNNRRTL